MVPKELLGNEEEGKGIPFLGSQKKGNQKRERATEEHDSDDVNLESEGEDYNGKW